MSTQHSDKAPNDGMQSTAEMSQTDAPRLEQTPMRRAWSGMNGYQQGRLAAAGICSSTSAAQLLAIYVYVLQVKAHRHVEARPKLLNICSGLIDKKI